MKPIIGISVDCEKDPADERTRGKLTLNWNYAQAVSDAGGVPILIPPTADMEVVSSLIHGFLIPGGNDIDASRWGEANHPKAVLQDPTRYEAEAALLAILDKDVPVLGICYGAQFLNVNFGGTLVQHLPDVVGHETHAGGTLQEYELEPHSRLAEAMGGTKVQGKSYHHQAVGEPGENLRVVARNQDGTVEAVESTDRPWLIGVQWHPERTSADPATAKLFRDFVDAARRYATHTTTVPS